MHHSTVLKMSSSCNIFLPINTVMTTDDTVMDNTDGKYSLAAYATSEEEDDYFV